jgi:cell wall-associated NlpC family hydrolase
MHKIILIILTAAVLLTGCKSRQKLTSTEQHRQNWELLFNKYKGVKYRYGGTGKSGFDCSGFVQRAYQEVRHLQLPRTTKAMMKTGKKISKNQLKPGDLVFFHPTRKYYHVGIYLGDGIFMHASTSKGVTKSNLHNKYWLQSYVTARRVL